MNRNKEEDEEEGRGDRERERESLFKISLFNPVKKVVNIIIKVFLIKNGRFVLINDDMKTILVLKIFLCRNLDVT